MNRADVVEAVRAAVEPFPWVHAMWEGGSASYGRLDEWSDVDLGLAVDEGRVEDGFALAERALEEIGPVAARWTVFPADHVKPQRLYRLADPAAPMVDLGVFSRRTRPEDRFVERVRHGTPLVLFDRCGFTDDVPSDPAAFRQRLRTRLADLASRVDFLGRFAVKSARRGDVAEAVSFYQSFVLAPLVEVLRIRHDPWRHDFGVRYLRFDVPEPARSRLFRLYAVRDLDDLLAKRDEAESWFREELAALDLDRVPLEARAPSPRRRT